MKPTTRQNIRNIRRTLGTGPVREEEPEPVKKAGKKVGDRERAMRAWREAQERSAPPSSGTRS